MHTLEQKKESIRLGKDKLRRDMSVHSLKDLNTFANLATEKPLLLIDQDPRFLLTIQLCIAITLGELLIEREEAELQKEKV